MRFAVSFDMLDPALCLCLEDIKTPLKAIKKLLLLLAWSLMQGPRNSIKKQVILKKIQVAFLFNVLPKKGLFTWDKGG